MARPFKSQWDFGGELFSAEAYRRVLTVGELTSNVKRLLEREVGQVWVTGEVSNLRVQSSGHVYFCLKDHVAQVNCVLFRGEARSVERELLKDGQKLVLHGDLTVYEARGQYQLRVTGIELQGTGALQIAFEKLKQKLNAEGLFAEERKRILPRYPERIGLVTSPTGAAIRDVLHVIGRRNPSLRLILASCRVQGQGAAEEIACAIRLLNDWAGNGDPNRRLDLILITRGGGSLEDLWAFNEEVVARAIFESKLPVVSAIGHEIDFTISDFVADIRAATPSVAAELITEGVFASREFIFDAPARIRQIVGDRIEAELEAVGRLKQRLERAHPRRRMQDRSQRLDDLQMELLRTIKYRVRERQVTLQTLAQRLQRLQPGVVIGRHRTAVRQLRERLVVEASRHLEAYHSRLAKAEARLRLLSPRNVLERGYSVTSDAATGRVIRDANEVKAGQKLKTLLKSGEIESVVEQGCRNSAE